MEDLGEWDNTLIIYISGDNGASAEGMVNGTPNEFTTFNGIEVPVKDQLLWYPFWGSDRTFPHFSAAWAWAMNTPFKWMKQVPSHFGGTAQGMAISWPARIQDAGGTRRQFHHVIDIVPTILEATGIPAPRMLDGIEQKPIEGTSLAYTWDAANADAPTKHTTQYFEMLGNRAIYHEGWVAATTPVTLPWELSTKPPPDVISGYRWELYNVMDDPTQNDDLAAKMPDKLAQLQNIFYLEAAKYHVLPLDNTTLARWNSPKPSLTAGRTEFSYSGTLANVPGSTAPNILNKSYTITAEVTIPKGGAEGMIVTEGGRFGGYGLFLSKGVAGVRRGKVVFLYNLLDLKRTIWEGPQLKPGKHTIVFDYKVDEPGLGKSGTGVLTVDGKQVDRKSMEHGTPITFAEDETFDVGLDTRTGVAMIEYRYDSPFKFTGTIETVQNLQAAQIQVVCDQPYTLTINQYIDAAGTKLTESTTLTRLANQPLCQNVLLPGNYFNVVLTNLGISDTTALQIDTTFGIMDTLPKTLGQKARDESMAVTLSVDDLEMLSDIRQALAPLMSARGTDGALRINSLGGTLTTVSTVTGVTTVSTVTSVTALANQTAMGGMQAGPHIPSLMNLAAQANIANMIG